MGLYPAGYGNDNIDSLKNDTSCLTYATLSNNKKIEEIIKKLKK